MTTSRQETLFDVPGEPGTALEKRTDFDRLEMVVNELGFIPHSRGELNHAMLALDNRDVAGGYARHLNEVLRHQQKSRSSDPPAALRSIISSIKGYADSTRGDKTTLLEVAEELQPFAGNQHFLELGQVASLGNWSLQPGTKRGLGLINRQLNIEKAMREGEWVGIEGFDREDSIADMLDDYRIYEALAAIDTGLLGADKRHEFWVSRLEQATHHYAVRAIAQQALDKLGVAQ